MSSDRQPFDQARCDHYCDRLLRRWSESGRQSGPSQCEFELTEADLAYARAAAQRSRVATTRLAWQLHADRHLGELAAMELLEVEFIHRAEDEREAREVIAQDAAQLAARLGAGNALRAELVAPTGAAARRGQEIRLGCA